MNPVDPAVTLFNQLLESNNLEISLQVLYKGEPSQAGSTLCAHLLKENDLSTSLVVSFKTPPLPVSTPEPAAVEPVTESVEGEVINA